MKKLAKFWKNFGAMLKSLIPQKIKTFWFIHKNFRFKIITYNKLGSDWTLYKKLLREFDVDHKLMKEIMDLYGNKFCNVVEYYQSEEKTETGYAIWKIKQDLR